MPICCKYCKSQNLLALAKTNVNVFNAIKSVQNATLIFFSLSKIKLM